MHVNSLISKITHGHTLVLGKHIVCSNPHVLYHGNPVLVLLLTMLLRTCITQLARSTGIKLEDDMIAAPLTAGMSKEKIEEKLQWRTGRGSYDLEAEHHRDEQKIGRRIRIRKDKLI
jgi:hypothetical protein